MVEDHVYFKYKTPKGVWAIAILGTRVCNNLVEYLRESIEGGKAAEYWIYKRGKMTEEGYFQVDWEANKLATKESQTGRKHWVTTFESGWCLTGTMMKICKQRLVSNCPRCYAKNKTSTHILKCHSKAAQITRNKSIETLGEWLQSSRTCPDIIKLILNGMSGWKNGLAVSPPQNLDFDDVQKIFESQQ